MVEGREIELRLLQRGAHAIARLLDLGGRQPDQVECREASALAARGEGALAVALKVAGTFEGSAQQIVQVNDGGEAPSKSRVTVVRDGLLDDAVGGGRWEVLLERTTASLWWISEVKRAWRCRRGGQTGSFATLRCP